MITEGLAPQDQLIKLNDYQEEFVCSSARYPAMVSAWGTGKDMSALIKGMILSKESEDNLGMIVRMEFEDLSDSTVRDFESYFGIKVDSHRNAVIPTYARDSHIMFRHLEELNNLQNINLGWFMMIQADEIPDDSRFWLLTGRLRRKVRRHCGGVTANANGHNWIYNIWVDPDREGIPERIKKEMDEKEISTHFPCWQATSYDNAHNLPKEYVESWKLLPERIYKRLILNDHSVAQGLVWPEFDEHKHTCLSYEVPDEWKVAIGLDHGHDHPTAVVFGAIDYDGKLIIYDEHVEAGKLISYHAQKIKEKEPLYDTLEQYIDPTCRFRTLQDKTRDRVYSVIDGYADEGFHFTPAPADSIGGINLAGELFKSNRILIFADRCPNLVKEIKAWKWKQPKEGNEKFPKEEAVRLNEDTCKALIYLVSGRFDKTPLPEKKPEGMTEAKYLEEIEYIELQAQED